ncbi:alpha 1,2 mannosyltransferase [Rhodotorula toruloides]
MTLRRYTRLYGVVALLRILIAFTSTSAIHPDEHFQNPEISASTVFEYARWGDGLLQTWEWEATAPCRSIVPVLGSTGWSLALLKLAMGGKPTDYLIWSTSNGSPISLLMFASSPVVFTFLLRPFSNSLETLLLAAAFRLAPRRVRRDSQSSLIAFGAVLALGVFTRITFVAFAAPLVLDVAQRCASQPSRSPQWVQFSASQGAQVSTAPPRRSPLLRLAKRSIPIVLAFAITSLACAITDTIYFSSSGSAPLSRLVLTPFNLLRYNLSAANLAEHGLHPRYMHVLVNWPMLFGAGLAVVPTAAASLRGAKDTEWKPEERRRIIRNSVAPAVRVTDLAGAPFDTLVSTLFDQTRQQSSVAQASHTALLVAPAYTVHSLDLLCSVRPTSAKPHDFCLEPVLIDKDGKERTFGVHVDMDRLDELRYATWRTGGVGVWAVQRRITPTLNA